MTPAVSRTASTAVPEHRFALTVADMAELAARRLPRDVLDFVNGGSGDESAQAANRAALDGIRLVPRVLAGTDEADTSGKLLHSTVGMPLAVAPMAYQRLLHPDGELAAARAAHAARVPFVISTLSSYSIEEIAAAGGLVWFQLYWLRGLDVVLGLVRRAEAAGCEALVVTVDVPRMGRRLRDVRNGFSLPPHVTAANLGPAPDTTAHSQQSGTSAIATHTAQAFDPAIGWDDLAWLREQTALPLLVKGILAPQDAVRAVEIGADGVIVPTTEAVSSRPLCPASLRCRRSSMPSAGGARSYSTAGFAAARTSCAPSRSARTELCAADRCCGGWP